MSAAEFNRRGAKIFGYGWKTRLARELRCSISAVKSWSYGIHPVPQELAAKFAGWATGELRIRTPQAKMGGGRPRNPS